MLIIEIEKRHNKKVDRIRWDTVSYLPFYYVFFQFLLLTIFNLQANILTTKDILSNLVYLWLKEYIILPHDSNANLSANSTTHCCWDFQCACSRQTTSVTNVSPNGPCSLGGATATLFLIRRPASFIMVKTPAADSAGISPSMTQISSISPTFWGLC